MKLVIVESPTKAKTIGRFLGNDYVIRASMGHVMDLPKSKLGVDVEHDFKPEFEISADKKKTITELKKLAKDADGIILATDPDREGEAISAHIEELLGKGKKFVRATFHEITQDAIENALKNPGVVNKQLVDAQTARRVLDRLVGYKLSPLLWQKVRRGLSAGRVQSVALRLIVEREREIQKFNKKEYWTITISLSQNLSVVASEAKQSKITNEIAAAPAAPRNDASTDFELIEINGEKIEMSETFKLYDGEYKVSLTNINSKEAADKIDADLKTKIFTVSDISQKETKRSPQMPYTTSTLQQDASRRFGLSGKRTMSLAQKLYEEGFITYHRTDSVNMATKAVFQIRDFVKKSFGEKYIPEKPRFYKTKQKLAQEAHEAIRPTNVSVSNEKVDQNLGPQYAKLYDMIWRRAVASQMSDAITQSTTVLVEAKSDQPNTYLLKTTGSVLLFDGFLKVNPFGLGDRKLPQFESGEKLNLIQITPIQHETPPPPRYNDASIVSSLEEEGIGRPSTYATIISVIEARLYIERLQGRFIPTSVGMAVNDFLVKNFSDIDDIPFTANMEDELDAIANDGRPWVPMIRDFYTPFEKKLAIVKKADRVEIPTEEIGENCPKDGAPLVIRVGRFGKFISCKNFPNCDYKRAYIEETNFICPKDGGKIIVRKTKKGRTFYGCSNYPKCDFAVWKLSDLKRGAEGEKTTKKRKSTSKK